MQRGTANNPQMSLTKINDEELLMVFVGDVPTRSAANCRAVFYAIGDGQTWSNPQILDDDGTVDDYPNVCDLGDGRLLVTWSSGDQVLPDDATLEDSLKNLDLKAAFFHKNSKTFDEPVQLTHTTEEDYSADVMPHAAYDPETGRLLLTYTKTEYDDLANQENFGKAVSVIAYLFYQDGEWKNTGDAYTEEELDDIAGAQEAYKAYYKEQWYGQRFLDLRTSKDPNAPLLRVIESDAIDYNGLALTAWTVDWDGSLETTTDRDVFLQIYNFSENSFTHIIRVTERTGQHSLPRFARSDNNTWLFYGAQTFNEETGELNENGEIRYLNISGAVRDERYTLVETDTSRYYALKYMTQERAVEGPEGETTIPAEEVWYPTDTAAQCDNITDYTVFVDGSGQMYLFFSDMDADSNSRLIHASMYLGTDDESKTEREENEEVSSWSIPVSLTDGESVCYAGIGGVALDNVIYLASGKSSYEDTTDTSLVLVRHEPYAELTLNAVDAADAYPLPGGSTGLTATLRNIGLRAWTDPFDVTFTMTAKDKDGKTLTTSEVTAQHETAVIGGAETQVTAYVDIPEMFDSLTFTASYEGQTVDCERTSGSFLGVSEEAVGVRLTESGSRQQYASAVITNNGNKSSGLIAVSCYTGSDGYLNGMTLPALAPGESASFDLALEISDSAYEIDEDGLGLAQITASVVELDEESIVLLESAGGAGDSEPIDPSQISSANGSTVTTFSGTAQKNFDAEAIALLQNVTVPKNLTFTVREDENGPVQPELGGTNGGKLRIDWISTSDPSVLTIDATNAILPHTAGTAVLTGIVTPRHTNFVYSADGTSARQDWRDVIPEGMQRTVTAEVTVLAAESAAEVEPAPEGSHNVVFDSQGGSAVDVQVVKDGESAVEPTAPTRNGYTFLGWSFDGEAYDFSERVTEDLTLEARWKRGAGSADTPTPSNPGSGGGSSSGGSSGGGSSSGGSSSGGSSTTKKPTVKVNDKDGGKETITSSTVTIKPADGWQAAKVTVNGKEVTLPANGKITGLKSSDTVEITYEKISDASTEQKPGETEPTDTTEPETEEPSGGGNDTAGAKPRNPFTDVTEGRYYFDAVLWAVENGITNGKTATLFAPDNFCTRAQVVTFLWRAAGGRECGEVLLQGCAVGGGTGHHEGNHGDDFLPGPYRHPCPGSDVPVPERESGTGVRRNGVHGRESRNVLL